MKGLLRIRVIPNAARTELVGRMDDVWKIKVQVPAEGGKANRALIEFFSTILGCPRRAISISFGEKSRIKGLEVDGLSNEAIEARMIHHLE
ncbi:MAG TPA: hypothetical protein DIU37_05550 [Opitutae bacterium]|nr:hypothetical protein [Opitutae bacterium]